MTDDGTPDDDGPESDGPGGSSGTTEVWTGDGSDDGPPGGGQSNGGSDDREATPEPSGVPETYREWDGPDRRPASVREWLRWAYTVETGPVMIAREVVSSVAFVAAVGLLLFAVSGVWPPLVAVQSGSMEPHMHRGDLVFVVEEGRYAGDAAVAGTGVVTYHSSDGYDKFGTKGDVIVYEPDGSDRRDPIIHRARFWVEDGERWYDEADKSHVDADSCRELRNCPAPNSGFVTKGDANDNYDQAEGMSRPVKPRWVRGKAMVRVPWLGYLRLVMGSLTAVGSLGRGVATAFGVAVVSTRLVGR